MEPINIKSTSETPEINFNLQGEFSLKGISTPPNVISFYQPLFDWIKEFKVLQPKSIRLEMFIDYLNTSSTRIMVELINLLNSFSDNGTVVNFVWIHDGEDEDMIEMGEEFEIVTNTTFSYKVMEA